MKYSLNSHFMIADLEMKNILKFSRHFVNLFTVIVFYQVKVKVVRNDKGEIDYFLIHKCDDQKNTCPDGHPQELTVKED